jgi:putative restriction endonuclease
LPRPRWFETVQTAIQRYVSLTNDGAFTRQGLIDAELSNMIAAVGSSGATPAQTLSRELQSLRDYGLVEFVDGGTYRWTGVVGLKTPASKGVLVTGPHSAYRDEPERIYRFGSQWLNAASRLIGEWIVYLEPRRAGSRGYYAAAKISEVVADPATNGMYLALIEAGSYLEFGNEVPFRGETGLIERGVGDQQGRTNSGLAVQSIRTLSDADFNRIIDAGLAEKESILPREDEDTTLPRASVREEHAIWESPVDRTKALVTRTVRDRQFRKCVLGAYNETCALTGMRLINGGGRAETEAAHIMSVEAGGPDSTNNGIALSGTVHWMFDRGLISLADDGAILLSRKINDYASVDRLIVADRKAILPKDIAQHPHCRYLEWHRQHCFHS